MLIGPPPGRADAGLSLDQNALVQQVGDDERHRCRAQSGDRGDLGTADRPFPAQQIKDQPAIDRTRRLLVALQFHFSMPGASSKISAVKKRVVVAVKH